MNVCYQAPLRRRLGSWSSPSRWWETGQRASRSPPARRSFVRPWKEWRVQRGRARPFCPSFRRESARGVHVTEQICDPPNALPCLQRERGEGTAGRMQLQARTLNLCARRRTRPHIRPTLRSSRASVNPPEGAGRGQRRGMAEVKGVHWMSRRRFRRLGLERSRPSLLSSIYSPSKE
jgi:hypothetical protein